MFQHEVRRRVLDLKVEPGNKLNVAMIECLCKYLLVNTAHTYEHESTVAVTKVTVRSAGAVGLQLYRCCRNRGGAVALELPTKCGLMSSCPLRSIPAPLFRVYVFVPIGSMAHTHAPLCTVRGRRKRESFMCYLLLYRGYHKVDSLRASGTV